ncbi:MAG: hypothetical protein HPY57_13525 [Ignavibacteria bacterium]|nr:hypothetical protein [Ignavibacteria bacterium]
MILTKKLTIKTTNKNITHYKNLGYEIKSGDIIEIIPDELPFSSKTIIEVSCDICNKTQKISIFSYRRNINNYGYYTCKKCSDNKKKETCIKKYGVDSYTKTDEYILKTKETKNKRYGNENFVNIEKQKETNNKKYGKDYYIQTDEFKNKTLETMNNKFGVDYALQSDIILSKLKMTNNKKYGCDFVLQSDEIKNKIKNTKKEKYGYENYNNRLKFKNTCVERFGVENPMKNEIIKQKLMNIIYEKYGVYYPMQLEEFYLKMIKNGYKIEKYENSDLYYQGTYEKDFLDKYYSIISIKRGPTIKYEYNGIEHYYYSDFYYEKLNLIIEIKSKKWYEEHLEKNIIKEKACREQGYNYIFIIDKNYTVFDQLIKHEIYNKNHCWQYDLRLNTLNDDIEYLKTKNIDINDININDFELKYVDNNDKVTLKEITKFIKKYEWLGKMPNRPTHRFIATYKGIIGGVIIMSIPNSFSKFLGDDTKDIEKLISRGACASWTPKNLASKLLMWSIRWMVKNTNFRIFEAYSDTEAKEIGTIYQACNFYYLGQKFGSDKLYFNLNNPDIGWVNNRNYTKIKYMQKIAKLNNIEWKENWGKKYKILWENMPQEVSTFLKEYSKRELNNCLVRKTSKKHKYVYILGKNKTETKKLRKLFLEKNKIYDYIKR